MKTCCVCKQEKPLTEYHKDSQKPGGLSYRCKDCTRIKTHEYNARTMKQRVAYAAEYQRLHPDSRKHKRTPRELRCSRERRFQVKSIVHYHIKKGDIPRADALVCAWDGCDKQAAHHHHWNYEPGFELDVIPLCRFHHFEIHRFRGDTRIATEAALRIVAQTMLRR